MTLFRRVLVIAALSGLSGCACGGSATSPPTPIPVSSAASSPVDLTDRFDAATGITDTSVRNQSRAAVLIDAAKAGDSDVVIRCLDMMTDTSFVNASALAAVGELAKAGQGKEAKTVTNKMTDADLKNKALAKIAGVN